MKPQKIFSIIAFIASITVAVLTVFVTEFSPVFLFALFATLALVIAGGRNFGKQLANTSRILLGILFIFSGFVKGVDPIGTEYQFNDYFTAYGMDWAQPLALIASFAMNSVEFIIGIALLLNLRTKVTAVLAGLMMLMFTGMTLYDAIFNSVSDCGCFGKALTLSNWQTFYKNLVIDAFILILLFNNRYIKETFTLRTEIIIAGVFVLGFLGFQYYNYRYIPVIDFLNWQKDEKVVFDNEKNEWLTNAIPFADEVWNDDAKTLATNKGKTYLFCIYDLEHVNLTDKENIINIMDHAKNMADDERVIFLTDTKYLESDPVALENFMVSLDRTDVVFRFSDDKSIKGLIRSNPGLILIENGVVKGKWSCRNIPTIK